ncbi:MAG TPA: nucleotidyltransferase [Noviherbaspirillum sp.]|uniref:nucleotidyltransferase n=1 Tax=Noviherbaspirillum sp. TaxID=1926288 RepID=UPI002D3500EF|nr:nucleotidyltransferase [Noviherbaspirillum sp.]HYD95576.1 nucleotidyltransferase [Noviherbaspirillum sp.]
MQADTPLAATSPEPEPETAAFYRQVLDTLNASGVPFLVGGAYAFNRYTGINRHTKDLDVFIRRTDFDAISAALRAAGHEAELTFPHWLGKVHFNGVYIDLIFSSGNGIAEVDDLWFKHAGDAQVLGVPVKISPAEEMIWSKAFIMERERYDGADIIHLLRARGDKLDWPRLLWRFGEHWRVLLSHLVLFGFAYPAYRDLVPPAVMAGLIEQLRQETLAPPPEHNVCLGTLLSREQYLKDIGDEGWQDARVAPHGNMTPEDTETWTRAIEDKKLH